MAVDIEILEDFKTESKGLIKELLDLLEEADGDPNFSANLEQYGQTVDRIMGGAKSLATNFPLDFPPEHMIHQMGDYAAVCKAVGYKASQIKMNETFYNVCVAFLLDATETLKQMVAGLGDEESLKLSQLLNKTFLDRLRWINAQFKGDVRGTVAANAPAPNKLGQSDIDELLRKLGIA